MTKEMLSIFNEACIMGPLSKPIEGESLEKSGPQECSLPSSVSDRNLAAAAVGHS